MVGAQVDSKLAPGPRSGEAVVSGMLGQASSPSGGQWWPGDQRVSPGIGGAGATCGETPMGRPGRAPRLTLRVPPDSPSGFPRLAGFSGLARSCDTTNDCHDYPLSFFSPASLLRAALPGKLRQSRAAGKAGAGV